MNAKRSHIVLSAIVLALSLARNTPAQESATDPDFTFGVIADCQYCDVEGSGIRKYSLSGRKLQDAVTHLNTMDLKYVVHLGDFIDRDAESFDVVGPIFNRLKARGYHVLGNHDFSVADSLKLSVPKTMGLISRYYDFEIEGWRFVVLDGNDLSFYAHPKDNQRHAESAAYYERNNLDAPKWNGAVGTEQLAWLESLLEKASRESENVVLYCHFPIYPKDAHVLWNAKEVLELIEAYPSVKAYINGHNHAGNYATHNGIHFLTLKAMVDTKQTSYATVEVYSDRLALTGYGREEDRVMAIRSKDIIRSKD